MIFSLPHHPKSWTRESKKGRNRSKRTCMGLSCLSRTLIREVSQTSVRLLMGLPSLTTKYAHFKIQQSSGIKYAHKNHKQVLPVMHKLIYHLTKIMTHNSTI